ncbi:hypothetical protein G3480_01920 [Thiorhodococcus mannitoliphagus]|uniref:Uncharacterized protein n=1 Tax=Thiorhodococcus mannitoliphagus TaxID=329406 RepID=A0A6P1DM00_9GAMM|nr:hypothetical protein [Thiorhodococcus mannitoliphagus]NEX19078.1 hypothetical protein [Thiorhodococcus mannitoliphagus]
MRTWTNRLSLAILTFGFALPLAAQPGSQSIPDWMARQQEEIQRGVDAGVLTEREARSLRREQREIRQLGDSLRRDAYPPHEARRRLEERLRAADRRIYDLKNNDEFVYGSWDDRPPPPPPGGYDSGYPRPHPNYR